MIPRALADRCVEFSRHLHLRRGRARRRKASISVSFDRDKIDTVFDRDRHELFAIGTSDLTIFPKTIFCSKVDGRINFDGNGFLVCETYGGEQSVRVSPSFVGFLKSKIHQCVKLVVMNDDIVDPIKKQAEKEISSE